VSPASTVSCVRRGVSCQRRLSPSAPALGPDQRAYRLTSIDLLRGLVVVILAVPHQRIVIAQYEVTFRVQLF